MTEARGFYLGDSVYIEHGSFHGEIVLTTNNGYPDDPRNKIAMEPAVLHAFIEWLKHQGIYTPGGPPEDIVRGGE